MTVQSSSLQIVELTAIHISSFVLAVRCEFKKDPGKLPSKVDVKKKNIMTMRTIYHDRQISKQHGWKWTRFHNQHKKETFFCYRILYSSRCTLLFLVVSGHSCALEFRLIFFFFLCRDSSLTETVCLLFPWKRNKFESQVWEKRLLASKCTSLIAYLLIRLLYYYNEVSGSCHFFFFLNCCIITWRLLVF